MTRNSLRVGEECEPSANQRFPSAERELVRTSALLSLWLMRGYYRKCLHSSFSFRRRNFGFQ